MQQSWPAVGPKLLWTYRGAGHGITGMSIVGNRLYSMWIEGKPGDGCIAYVYIADPKTKKKL